MKKPKKPKPTRLHLADSITGQQMWGALSDHRNSFRLQCFPSPGSGNQIKCSDVDLSTAQRVVNGFDIDTSSTELWRASVRRALKSGGASDGISEAGQSQTSSEVSDEMVAE